MHALRCNVLAVSAGATSEIWKYLTWNITASDEHRPSPKDARAFAVLTTLYYVNVISGFACFGCFGCSEVPHTTRQRKGTNVRTISKKLKLFFEDALRYVAVAGTNFLKLRT
jgi:hypothetical protein